MILDSQVLFKVSQKKYFSSNQKITNLNISRAGIDTKILQTALNFM